MSAGRLAVAAFVLTVSLGAAPGAIAQPANASPGARPNVLFIVVDDLNDWVGYLGGNAQSATPNLDRLAQRGVRFTNAHAPVTVCNPSRAAFLSGLRPWTTGVYDNAIDWRPIIPESQMITAQFRKAGYWVGGTGKVPHHLRESDWDEFVKSKDGFVRKQRGDPLHMAQRNEVPDDAMLDHRNVTWAVGELRKERDQPFFLAVGLTKPHLPWNVPWSYHERWAIDDVELPPFLETDLDDLPPRGLKMAREVGQGATPQTDHERIVAAGMWKENIRGYLASIAFMDVQVGRLIDALDSSPHRADTIVVLFSDHGWHLGEKHHWRKQTLWEEATRVPMLFVAPGVTRPDAVCERTVDLMALYPTLMELTGLPVPEHVQGESIKTLLVDPAARWDQPAITTYLYKNHSVRTADWRYIRYEDGSEELYDERRDPNEWTNLAGKAEHADLKKKLAAYLPETDAPPGPRMEGAPDD